MQTPTFHRGPYRHPFSDDPEDQHPPTNTIFFSNPPLDAALDEFSKLLESQPGYCHSSAYPLNSRIHYLAEFDGEPAAQTALLKLYGMNFSASKQGPLRCSFAEPRGTNELPAAEHSEDAAELSEVQHVPTDAQDQFWPVHRHRQSVSPGHREPTDTIVVKFPPTSARRIEVREILNQISGFSHVRFLGSISLAVRRGTDCGYAEFDSIGAAVDAKLKLESTKLCGCQRPLRVLFKLAEPDAGAARRPSPIPEDHTPPAKSLYVTFGPNTPSMQLDVKNVFTQQSGFVRLDFVEPWEKETRETGHCYVHFTDIDAATAALQELNGHPPRPGTKRMRVRYSRSVSPTKPGGANSEEKAPYDPSSQDEGDDDVAEVSRMPDRGLNHQDSGSSNGPPRIMTPWTQGRRAEREEPTASLYMANLASDLTSAEAYDLFYAQEGVIDVRYILKRQPHIAHPMVFVDFKDCNFAALAKDRLWGAFLKGRPLRPHFNRNTLKKMESHLPVTLPTADVDGEDLGEASAVLVMNLQGRTSDTQMRNVFSGRKGFQTFKFAGPFLLRRAVVYFDNADCAAQTVKDLDGYKFDYQQADNFALHLRHTTVRAADAFLAAVSDSGKPPYHQKRPCPEPPRHAPHTGHRDVSMSEYEDSWTSNNAAQMNQYANSDSGYSEPDKFDDSQDEDFVTTDFKDESQNHDQHTMNAATAGSSLQSQMPYFLSADPVVEPAADAHNLMPDYVTPISPNEKTCHGDAANSQVSTTTTSARDRVSTSLSHKQHLMSLFKQHGRPSGSPHTSGVPSHGSTSSTSGKHARIMSAAEDLKDLHSFYTTSTGQEEHTQPEQTMDHVDRPLARKENCDSELLNMPMEIRDQIYHLVFNSTLVLMTDIAAFRQYSSVFFPTTATNATSLTGIRPDVFPCLERHSRLPECPIVYGRRPPLPEQVFGRILSCHSIPFQRKHSMRGLSARPTNASLLLTCRQLSSEFREHIQGRLILAFSSQKALLQHFDMTLSGRAHKSGAKVALDDKAVAQLAPHVAKTLMDKSLEEQFSLNRRCLLRNLSLEIGLYGEPHSGNLRCQRSKYYDNWKRACRLIAEELPQLQHVAVSVHVPPTVETKVSQLNLTALWAQPLVEFGKFGRLQTASVTLVLRYHSHGCTVDTGRGFAEVMRRKMMGLTDEAALEALAECKAGQRMSPSNTLTQHNAWVEVETSNGLPAIGLSALLRKNALIASGVSG